MAVKRRGLYQLDFECIGSCALIGDAWRDRDESLDRIVDEEEYRSAGYQPPFEQLRRSVSIASADFDAIVRSLAGDLDSATSAGIVQDAVRKLLEGSYSAAPLH